LRRAKVAISWPWNESMKQTRKMSSPTWVTFGLVEAGVTSGIPLAWAMTAASSVLADERHHVVARNQLLCRGG